VDEDTLNELWVWITRQKAVWQKKNSGVRSPDYRDGYIDALTDMLSTITHMKDEEL
jgi:hypothetical protein